MFVSERNEIRSNIFVPCPFCFSFNRILNSLSKAGHVCPVRFLTRFLFLVFGSRVGKMYLYFYVCISIF
jgi:hypothetical protein